MIGLGNKVLIMGVVFGMNKNLRVMRPAIIFLVLFMAFAAVSGCRENENTRAGFEQPEFTPGHLTITGNGVEKTNVYKLIELKDMKDACFDGCYSVVNDWPTRKFAVGKGIKINNLLKEAGIKPGAQKIVVWAADGYCKTFTRMQLEEDRFCFPGLLDGLEENAKTIPTILAWEYREGTDDLAETLSCDLRLMLGQNGLDDTTAPAWVKDVVGLEITTESPDCWAKVFADPQPGNIKPGSSIELGHPQSDNGKIYYTIDGSTPDEKSFLYNPSTSYFQPDLSRPITVNDSTVIKAVMIGFGKTNSDIAVFAYDVQ